MSIATEKLKMASERFALVRLEPARYIDPTSVGGGVYQESAFPFVVSRVQRNGVDLTEVSSVSNNDEYSWDESTGNIQVKLASAPDVDDNVIVVFYYLFFTSIRARAAYETPSDDTTPLREWLPYVQANPSFLQSFTNVRAGIMTIADSQLKLINDDRYFQERLTDDDSFYNKKAEVWVGINSTENLQKLFDGKMTRVSIQNGTVSIDISDNFSVLRQSAYMADTEYEAVFTRQTGSFPDLQPSASGKPCPFIIAASSRYLTQTFDYDDEEFTVILEGTPAYCTDYDEVKNNTVNREWGLCRSRNVIGTQPDLTGDISSVTKLDTVTLPGFGPYHIRFTFSVSGLQNSFFVGDTFRFSYSGTDYHWRIVQVTSTTIDCENQEDEAYTGTLSNLTSLTHDPCPAMSIIVKGIPSNPNVSGLNATAFPLYGRDYTLTTSSTSGGNNYHKITFTSAFEDNFDGTANNSYGTEDTWVLDPDLHSVQFRITTSISSLGVELGYILENAGMQGIFGSWGDMIDDYMSLEPAFHIPNIDEFEYDHYLKYVEDILSSALCYLYISDSGNVRAAPLTLPISTTERGTGLTLDGATGVNVDYQDIVTTIIPYNPHNDSNRPQTPDATVSSNKAKYLHGIQNTDRMKHCLYRVFERLEAHIGLKSNRTANYTYEVSTEDIDTDLGDDVLINNPIVLGTSEEQAVKILSLEKGAGKIVVEASDLLGITDIS